MLLATTSVAVPTAMVERAITPYIGSVLRNLEGSPFFLPRPLAYMHSKYYHRSLGLWYLPLVLPKEITFKETPTIPFADDSEYQLGIQTARLRRTCHDLCQKHQIQNLGVVGKWAKWVVKVPQVFLLDRVPHSISAKLDLLVLDLDQCDCDLEALRNPCFQRVLMQSRNDQAAERVGENLWLFVNVDT